MAGSTSKPKRTHTMRKTRSAPAGRGRGRSGGSLLRGGGRGGFRADDLVVAHEPERWLAEFNSYGNGTSNPDMANIRAMRLLIQEQTFAVCETGRYVACADAGSAAVEVAAEDGAAAALAGVPEGVPPQAAVELQPSARRRTTLCRASPETIAAAFAAAEAAAARRASAGAPAAAAAGVPFVEVRSMDCLEAARGLCGAGERVAVLNMANAYTPGGGFRAGCGAQEENLHRRSDLHLFLEDRRVRVQRHFLGFCWKKRGNVRFTPDLRMASFRKLINCGLRGQQAWAPPQTRLYPIPDDAALYSPASPLCNLPVACDVWLFLRDCL